MTRDPGFVAEAQKLGHDVSRSTARSDRRHPPDGRGPQGRDRAVQPDRGAKV